MPRFITRTHTEEISPDHLEYRVRTEGSVAPFNDEIVIANDGPDPLDDPVVTVDGRYGWSTIESMVAEITRGCATDEEKALAIFTWCRLNGDHQYSGDRRALNPVVFFNVFGHGICAYFASAQTALARTAGLDARVWEITGHTISEIFYDDAWHMLDPDCHLFFLARDNRTIASIEQIEKDLDFYARTKAFQRIFADAYGKVRNEWQSQHNVWRYGLDQPRYVQYDYDPYTYAPASMNYTLLPGELISRSWKGNGKHFDYRNQRRFEPLADEPHKPFPPARYANGYVRYRPNLDEPFDLSRFTIRNLKWTPGTLQVDRLQDSGDGTRSLFTYSRPLPYLLVGGKVTGEAIVEGNAAYDLCEVVGYKQTHKLEWQPFYEQKLPGRRRFSIDLDDFLYPAPDNCAWQQDLQVILASYSGNEPRSTTALTDLDVTTEFQVASQSLPALALGENEISILHHTPEDRRFKARVTHTWTERHGIPPTKPPLPLTPEEEVALSEEGIRFTWNGRGDGNLSYHFQLSLHPQCAFPLSPNFDVDLKEAIEELTVEKSWFNRETTYYWRIRAKSRHGIWGQWSAIRSFTTG